METRRGKKRFGEYFDGPQMPLGARISDIPPKKSKLKALKPGGRAHVGIYLGYIHRAGGRVGPESHCLCLGELGGLNMKTAKTPRGKRPNVEWSKDIWDLSQAPGFKEGEIEIDFPMKRAYEEARNSVSHVASW